MDIGLKPSHVNISVSLLYLSCFTIFIHHKPYINNSEPGQNLNHGLMIIFSILLEHPPNIQCLNIGVVCVIDFKLFFNKIANPHLEQTIHSFAWHMNNAI